MNVIKSLSFVLFAVSSVAACTVEPVAEPVAAHPPSAATFTVDVESRGEIIEGTRRTPAGVVVASLRYRRGASTAVLTLRSSLLTSTSAKAAPRASGSPEATLDREYAVPTDFSGNDVRRALEGIGTAPSARVAPSSTAAAQLGSDVASAGLVCFDWYPYGTVCVPDGCLMGMQRCFGEYCCRIPDME
jgi:hypothetical protein